MCNLSCVEDNKRLSVYLLLIRTHKEILNGNFQCPHDLNTRQRDNATPTFQRLARTQQPFSYKGPTVWNKLPPTLKDITSLTLFKRKVKDHLLDSYTNVGV